MQEKDADRRQGFPPSKRRTIFREPQNGEDVLPPLRAVPHTGHLPLSFVEERFWFLEQLAPGYTASNLPLIFRLHGPLRYAALQRSLNELVRRHEILRTTFVLDGEQPVQVIVPELVVDLPLVEVPFVGAEQEAEAQRLLREEGSRPFDLAQGPLLRALLLRLNTSEHVLLLATHHIICDGWSFNLLHEEVSLLYAACSTRQPVPFARLPLQYGDYTLWQRQWMQGERLERDMAYWRAQLQDLPVLALPTDHPRTHEQHARGSQICFTFPRQFTRQLQDLRQREGGTLFQLLLAAFQVVLSQYSGQSDIVVGAPAAGRTHKETERLQGCFMNMLALRTDLSGDPTLREVLKRVKHVAQEGKAHQDLPFERLVEHLSPERRLDQHPLFQVMITLRHRVAPFFKAGELRIDLPVLGPTQATQVDLALAFDVVEDQLRGTVDYAVDLFEAETIHRFIGHFQMILRAMVAYPERRLSDCSLLTESEWRQLVVEQNATDQEYPREQCIHERFEMYVRNTPDAVAVVCGEQKLTYEQLNRRANQVAHALRAHGVGPEVLVGICVERSLEMIVGMLGILKAGGAFVPLEPELPAARRAFILEATGITVGLTQPHIREQLSETALTWLLLEPGGEISSQLFAEPPASGVCAANLAYVLFTSGSTGQPKGVQITHRALSNLIIWWQSFASVSSRDRATQFANMGFDLSVGEIWPVLCNGASLFILKDRQFFSPAELCKYLQDAAITMSWLPTSLAELVLQEPWSEPTSLRLLSTIGEQLHTFPAPRHPFPLINAYGPTEATVLATAGQVEAPGETNEEYTPALGTPVANTQIYVLNADLQPVPRGVIGELYIGGDGLARGYLRQPALTAERFLPNPFSQRAGERLYRTGDLARYRYNGELEFVGRSDHQVKVRGHRIELGEIEAVLRQHPAVQQVVVTLHTDQSGNKHLVAYVVPAPSSVQDKSAFERQAGQLSTRLRQALQERLPAYMLPWQIILLEKFPLNANGKVDRQALPAPQERMSREEAARVPPRTPGEKVLVEIWSEMLNVIVGIHENFFALGGDSLLVIKMVARAHQRGIHFTPRQVMASQTIAELASKFEQPDTSCPVARTEEAFVGQVSLTQFQAWFLQDRSWNNPHWWNVPFFCRTKQPLEYSLLRATVAYLRRYHDGLRTRFSQKAEQVWQAWISEPDDDHPLVWLDLSALSETEQQAAIKTQIARLQTSFDLTTGRCMQIAYFHSGSHQPGYLLCLFHHAIIDAYSLQIVLRDFQTIYQCLQRQEPVNLPPKTTSLKLLGERLAQFIAAPSARQELAEYWFRLPWHEVVSLPVDFPEKRTANTFGSLNIVTGICSQEETARLLSKGKESGTAILEMLVAAVIRSLATWIEDRPVVLGIIDHGREALFDEIDLSNTVGSLIGARWFPLRLPASIAPNEVLFAMKQQMRELPNRGSTYALQRLLSSEPELLARLRALPHHEIEFNYLGYQDSLDDEPLFASPEYEPEELDWWEDPAEKNSYLISFTSFFLKGQLNVVCRYSKNLYRQETIEAIMQRFLETLSWIAS